MPYIARLGPYGVPCDVWGGHPASHQHEARAVLRNVPPFTWVATCCPEKLCLTREHLIVHQPLRLDYPRGVCIYCGLEANHMDHLIPEPWSGPAARANVLTVPACRDCNCSLNDTLTFSITQRRQLAHERILKRHGKWLKCKYFTSAELRQFGHNLRTTIDEGMQMRKVTEARLAWPFDPNYDLDAIQAVGIEDPYAIGMLDFVAPEVLSDAYSDVQVPRPREASP